MSKKQLKAGMPPGTLLYTGTKKTEATHIQVVTYDKQNLTEKKGNTLDECLLPEKSAGIIWVNIEGLNDTQLISDLGKRFGLHPLVLEDILDINQRSKVDEFDNYVYIVLKKTRWNESRKNFSIEQVSIIFGADFLLSFQEQKSTIFDPIVQRLQNSQSRLRENGSDFLAYTLIDFIVDQYFIVLEKMDERIEAVEDKIVDKPTQRIARLLYKLKRQMLMFRKAIWPLREAVSHMLRLDTHLLTPFTAIYLRDVYDHTVQVIDTVETYRDMLAGLLDVYISTITNRLNEVMKVLTVIATIFIPLTFIASIYGMNFINMPELRWHYGYPAVLGLMSIVAIGMLIYFKRKDWL